MTSLEQVLQKIEGIKVIAPSIPYSSYVALDLSIYNQELMNQNLSTATDFENYIENYLKENQAIIAYGGYNETRNLYKRSQVFNTSEEEERNIHIGLDLWTTANTPILAALDGKIHSFQFNNQLGDYGPTIILEHKVDNHHFYTLYGHLSLESIQKLSKGQIVKKGEQIAILGKSSVNGDYAPHLHFQIIKDIQNKEGDYPGVCSLSTQAFYLSNCPDPNLLLKINT
ncbi:peptidoglycan DD-metalloendopeptidase family protein [Flavobacterium sp. RSSA_27]|uniref:peptidoglycan DD-metalloendopeptidase family protein n=1 Tax=Flavobacterium sp. RSSA_27 TaxID=3447667 RepID=UPI003F2A1663